MKFLVSSMTSFIFLILSVMFSPTRGALLLSPSTCLTWSSNTGRFRLKFRPGINVKVFKITRIKRVFRYYVNTAIFSIRSTHTRPPPQTVNSQNLRWSKLSPPLPGWCGVVSLLLWRRWRLQQTQRFSWTLSGRLCRLELRIMAHAADLNNPHIFRKQSSHLFRWIWDHRSGSRCSWPVSPVHPVVCWAHLSRSSQYLTPLQNKLST